MFTNYIHFTYIHTHTLTHTHSHTHTHTHAHTHTHTHTHTLTHSHTHTLTPLSTTARDYSRVDSVSPPKLAAERGTDTLTPPAASTSHTPLPAIQEVEEKSYPVRLVDRGTQTEAGFESSEEKHGPLNSAAGSNTGSQTRRRYWK